MIKYKATKYGNFMYNLCDKGAKFLEKHRWLYYLFNFTWGIIMTVIGLVIDLVMLICGQVPHKFHGTWYFETGPSWILYVVNFFWAILLGISWPIVLLVKKIRKRPKPKFKKYLATNPEYWGGLETGMSFIAQPDSSYRLRCHELGHTYQNAILGPFFIILVGLPSAIRYWYREFLYIFNKKKWSKLPPYDAIWFENSATDIGLQLETGETEYKQIYK